MKVPNWRIYGAKDLVKLPRKGLKRGTYAVLLRLVSKTKKMKSSMRKTSHTEMIIFLARFHLTFKKKI